MFASISCTITKNIDDVNEIANAELFSSFDLFIEKLSRAYFLRKSDFYEYLI